MGSVKAKLQELWNLRDQGAGLATGMRFLIGGFEKGDNDHCHFLLVFSQKNRKLLGPSTDKCKTLFGKGLDTFHMCVKSTKEQILKYIKKAIKNALGERVAKPYNDIFSWGDVMAVQENKSNLKCTDILVEKIQQGEVKCYDDALRQMPSC